MSESEREALEAYAVEWLLVFLAEAWLSEGLELTEIARVRTWLAIHRLEKWNGMAVTHPAPETDNGYRDSH
ncbi:MAG: hypothetical protein ACK5JI_07070 [Azonexus sp.]